MAEADSQAAEQASEKGAAAKKKTSVKVVRRVKSKKSEKGERPELAPPPTIEEQQQQHLSESPASPLPPSPMPAAAPLKQQVAASPPTERRLSSKRRAQRSGSNVFAMFTQNQIHQFKEAFGFIDQDKDGIISKADIRATFDALGRLCSESELAEMAAEAPGPINFTMFLSVFGERIQGTDEEAAVLEAFGRFDEGDGFCREDKLRNALTTWGEKFTKEECDSVLREAPVDARNRIDVRRLASLVTKGAAEEPDAEGAAA